MYNPQTLRLNVNERDMEREHQKQIVRRRQAREARERERQEKHSTGPGGLSDKKAKKTSKKK